MRLYSKFETHRRVVCRTCRVVIDDFEPGDRRGDFTHPVNYRDGTPTACPNVGKAFRENSNEVEVFEPKTVRRSRKRTIRSRLRMR